MKKTSQIIKKMLLFRHLRAGLTLAAATLLTASALAQQASLTLEAGNVLLAQRNNTAWSLDKVATSGAAIPGGTGTIIWQVTVTKGATSANEIVSDGYVRIWNSGSADATIGNIVVNLQRKSGKNWKTVASDIADATHGDTATTATISPTASSEGLSVFTENAASGPLEFIDSDSNTIFSLSPQKTIPPNGHIPLLFTAVFNNSLLGIPQGEQVRVELIVTFGNAGARGGSGAVSKNVDINGNGVIDWDEAFVRSVPCRTTVAVPALVPGNSQVTLTDPALAFTGTATAQNITSSIGSGITLTDSAAFIVTADANGGDNGGEVINTAFLDGQDAYSSLIIGYNTITNADGTTSADAVYFNFPLIAGVHLEKESCVEVGPVIKGINTGDFITFTQGGWGAAPHGNNPGALLTAMFPAVFPAGLEAGIPGTSGFSMKFKSAAAVIAYLPAGGTAKALSSDLVNPTSSAAGVFGGQVLALKLNVTFSAANVTQGAGGALGSLKLANTGTSLDGLTVAQILAVAETALGGGSLPTGYTIPDLNALATNLNEAFDNGTTVTHWAQTYLTK